MDEYKYRWHGIDRLGQPVTGELNGNNKAQIHHHLRQQRIRVTQIERQFTTTLWLRLRSQHATNKHEITQFTRQLATLLKAGVPLLQALDILSKGETRIALKALIADIHACNPWMPAERIRQESTTVLADSLRTLTSEQVAALAAALPALEQLGDADPRDPRSR